MKKTRVMTQIGKIDDNYLSELDDDLMEDTWRQKSRALQARRWTKLRRTEA